MTTRFQDMVERVYARSHFQRKRLAGYLESRDERFFADADEFAARYGALLAERGISIDEAVDAYLKMCSNMLRCQVEFMRTGRYPVASAVQANQNVYTNEKDMLSYMVGLGISQFLWSTHYAMFSFFADSIRERAASIETYLEVGPGHGLFLERALTLLPALEHAVAVDISETSLELTRDIIRHSSPGQEKVTFLLGDILEVNPGGKFDFITMGEVLEHVDRPQALLIRLREMLAANGRIFASTCANCPAIDHVYQFDTVAQIRALIESSGMRILRDLPLSVEDMSVDEAERRHLTINYCALLG